MVTIHEMGYEIYSVNNVGSAANTVDIQTILSTQEPRSVFIIGMNDIPMPL